MKKTKFTKASIILIFTLVILSIFAINVFAIEIDESNSNIEPYIMNIEGLHPSISAINTKISDNVVRLATFYISDFQLFVSYVDSLDWSQYNDLPYLMGLTSQPINNISQYYYSNIDDFTFLIESFGNFMYFYNSNTNLQSQISSLQVELSKKNAQILELNSTLTELTTENDLLSRDLAISIESINRLNQQNADLSDEIESLYNENIALEQDVAHLTQLANENYNLGYNEGFDDNKIFLNGLATVFSSPMYVFGEVFDFEFLGFNILTLIQMFLTIMLVAFIFKKVR